MSLFVSHSFGVCTLFTSLLVGNANAEMHVVTGIPLSPESNVTSARPSADWLLARNAAQAEISYDEFNEGSRNADQGMDTALPILRCFSCNKAVSRGRIQDLAKEGSKL